MTKINDNKKFDYGEDDDNISDGSSVLSGGDNDNSDADDDLDVNDNDNTLRY